MKNEISIPKRKCIYYKYSMPVKTLCDEHFWLLIELSGIRSEKIIMSLKDYLVNSFSKREAYERNGVSPSYFSGSLRKLSHIYSVSLLLSEYYHNDS